MKKSIEVAKYRTYAFPKITALVTSMKGDKPNVFTVAWHSPISSKPPLYGISVHPNRYSHELILEAKEFVVNFPDMALMEETHRCGRMSGRQKDKFELTGLTPMPAEKVKAPLIKECYSHLECRLYHHVTLGDHTWITGEVVAVHADEDRFENDVVKTAHPVLYLGKDMYTTVSGERSRIMPGNR
jgi:flavin reductase (DIM6/NTAB) family NADH-FMN oxidoreductase RutF